MKIGVATIGQSPRPDVVGEIRRVLGQDIEILEAGALDDLTLDEIQKIEPKPGEGILVTRMRDGTEVKITHDFVVPLLQERITELEGKGVNLILMLCTGRFPEFKAKSLIVMPSEIIRGVSRAALREGRLGTVLPSIQQIGGAPRERVNDGLVTYLDAASPYGPKEEIEELGDRLAKQNLDLILLNCMGFDHTMKQIIKEKTGKPVIQASSLVARALKELIS